MKPLLKSKLGASLGGFAMGLIFVVILIIGVGIPITNQVIDESNLTGLTATVVSFVPVFLALVVLVAAGRGAAGGM